MLFQCTYDVFLQLFKRQTDEASAKAKEKQEKRQSHFKVVAKRVCTTNDLYCRTMLIRAVSHHRTPYFFQTRATPRDG